RTVPVCCSAETGTTEPAEDSSPSPDRVAPTTVRDASRYTVDRPRNVPAPPDRASHPVRHLLVGINHVVHPGGWCLGSGGRGYALTTRRRSLYELSPRISPKSAGFAVGRLRVLFYSGHVLSLRPNFRRPDMSLPTQTVALLQAARDLVKTLPGDAVLILTET